MEALFLQNTSVRYLGLFAKVELNSLPFLILLKATFLWCFARTRLWISYTVSTHCDNRSFFGFVRMKLNCTEQSNLLCRITWFLSHLLSRLDCAAAKKIQKIEDDLNREWMIDILYMREEVATIEKLSSIQIENLWSKLGQWSSDWSFFPVGTITAQNKRANYIFCLWFILMD